MSLDLFLESCRSESTKEQYAYLIQKWFNYAGNPSDPKDIQDKIIAYIINLKKEGKAYPSIAASIVPVKTYYQINGVALNIKLIDKILPEQRKVKTDRSYTHTEISRLLEIANERSRVIILLLASSGIRIGAIPFITLGNLDGNKLTLYQGAKEEYFTFITPECRKTIDNYLDFRQRYGEKIADESYLIIKQSNIRDVVKPKPVSISLLQFKLYDLCKRCGIDKKDVAIAHGFRKFFTTQLVQSKVNPEIREMLLGHKIGLASAYYRPTEDEMYAEYEKAIDPLTINEENRLKKKIETLTIEKSRLDRIEEKMLKMEQMYQS
ncbi:hypothetical protein BH18THE1_BH18THE1_02830 [soil metagenome]